MAVEARHLNLFHQQLITKRNLMNTNQGNALTYNTQMGSAVPFTATMPEQLLPFHQSLVCDSLQPKISMKADSGLTYILPAPRKRSRDSLDQLNSLISPPQKNNNLHQLPYLGEDISFQIQQHQSEIDRIVTQHTKKIRMELEERQKQHAGMLIAAIGQGLMKELKEKDEQIQRMGKLNLVLQERVKSLFVENQLWRDLAQTNEAAANSLRSNLEQVLAHVGDEPVSGGGAAAAAVADEVESCCGSCDYGRDREEEEVVERRLLAEGMKDKEVAGGCGGGGGSGSGSGGGNRMCRKCGERESCVLLLPCRHLCLCTLCGSTLLQNCPVCNTNMNATVHVNMS